MQFLLQWCTAVQGIKIRSCSSGGRFCCPMTEKGGGANLLHLSLILCVCPWARHSTHIALIKWLHFDWLVVRGDISANWLPPYFLPWSLPPPVWMWCQCIMAYWFSFDSTGSKWWHDHAYWLAGDAAVSFCTGPTVLLLHSHCSGLCCGGSVWSLSYNESELRVGWQCITVEMSLYLRLWCIRSHWSKSQVQLWIADVE